MEILNRMLGEMKKLSNSKSQSENSEKSLTKRMGQSKERISGVEDKEEKTKPTMNPIHQNLQASSTTLPPNSPILLQSPWDIKIQFAPVLMRLKRQMNSQMAEHPTF